MPLPPDASCHQQATTSEDSNDSDPEQHEEPRRPFARVAVRRPGCRQTGAGAGARKSLRADDCSAGGRGIGRDKRRCHLVGTGVLVFVTPGVMVKEGVLVLTAVCEGVAVDVFVGAGVDVSGTPVALLVALAMGDETSVEGGVTVCVGDTVMTAVSMATVVAVDSGVEVAASEHV